MLRPCSSPGSCQSSRHPRSRLNWNPHRRSSRKRERRRPPPERPSTLSWHGHPVAQKDPAFSEKENQRLLTPSVGRWPQPALHARLSCSYSANRLVLTFGRKLPPCDRPIPPKVRKIIVTGRVGQMV